MTIEPHPSTGDDQGWVTLEIGRLVICVGSLIEIQQDDELGMVLLSTITTGTPAHLRGLRQGSGANGYAPAIQLTVRHGQPPILITMALWLPILYCLVARCSRSVRGSVTTGGNGAVSTDARVDYHVVSRDVVLPA